MNRTLASLIVLAVALPLLVAGCSGRPSTANVDVQIMYNGQPVSDVIVTFNSEGQRPAVGRTDSQGKVIGLTTFQPNDGVLPGEYVLTLSKASDPTDTIEDASAYQMTTPENLGFPPKYMAAQASDMKLTVQLGEPNQKTFELTD